MNNKYEEVIKRLDAMQNDIDVIMEHFKIPKEQDLKDALDALEELKEFKKFCEKIGVTVHIEEID